MKSILIAQLLLVLVAMVWGASYGITKLALAYVSVMAILALRFLLSAFLLLPLVLKQGVAQLFNKPLAVITNGIVVFCIFFFETYGVLHTEATKAVFLISLFVLFTMMFEWLLTDYKYSVTIFGLILVALIGVFLLTDANTQGFNKGDFFIVIAALLRGFLVVISKLYVSKKGITVLALTFWQSLLVGVGALLLLNFEGGGISDFINLPASFWMLVVFLVLFCTLFAFAAQNYGVKKLPAVQVAMLLGIEPVFGALFSYVWLGEPFSGWQWIGGLMISLSALLALLLKQPKPINYSQDCSNNVSLNEP